MARGVTFASVMALGPPLALELAREAAAAGYDSFWTAETTGPEAFSTLAAAAPHAPLLRLGTGVIPIQLRTPPLAAMGSATLQALHPGADVLLGVGVSSPAVTARWHGAEFGDRFLPRMREYVEVVRRCLTGETVSFDGDFYRISKFRLAVKAGRTPKIVLAALGPEMLRLAGEIADGVLLNYLPANRVPWATERVREGAAKRDQGRCEIYAYVHAGVGDREHARPKAARDLYSYAVVDSYANAFADAGFAEEIDELRDRQSARDRDGAIAAISDRMIDAINVVGDEQLVADTMRSYEDAGVDHPVLMPLPWGEDRLASLWSTVAAAAPAAP